MRATRDNIPEKMTASLFLATLEERSKRTVAPGKIAPIKEKQKTRATNNAPPLTTKEVRSDHTPNDATLITIYKVGKRDFRVFSMPFR